MKSSAKNIRLTSVDELFSTEESREDAQREKVVEIALSQLHPFQNHPFQVRDDQVMQETADSIREYGVLVPAIARPDPNGGYELIAGHRRHRASQLAGKETMPVIIRECCVVSFYCQWCPASVSAKRRENQESYLVVFKLWQMAWQSFVRSIGDCFGTKAINYTNWVQWQL